MTFCYENSLLLLAEGATNEQIVYLCCIFIFFCNTTVPLKPPDHKRLGVLKIRFRRTKKIIES